MNRYQYSLHPDNINGWKSKHALYSVPLLYGSNNIDQVLRSVLNDDRYKLAYLGRRHSSSVQVNKCNHYPWKYRESELKTLVAEELRKAVDSRVGKPEQCEYTFDSNFESGNLDAAIRIKPNEYDCFLRCDTNTRGHTNWYYFKVSNHEHIGELSLTICNIGKARNLYSRGMKPYSRCHSEWTQESCYDVLFGERYLRYGEDKKSYHLQFKYNFKQPNQTVEFAYAIPYTYSDLCTFIDRLKDQNGTLVNSRKLCDSLGSLSVPLLTITSPSCP